MQSSVVLFNNRNNLIGWDMFPFPDNARRKGDLEMGNFLFKIQTEVCFLKIL